MNLTVAMKIIGGFAILFILLIITSTISLMNLSTINTSLTQQNELAIPTLQGSNELANELMEMGSLTLQAYYQTESDGLSEIKSTYSEVSNNFSKEHKLLTNIIKNEAKLSNNLKNVDGVYASLTQNIDDVFTNHKKPFLLKVNLPIK